MAITTAMTNQFKMDALSGLHLLKSAAGDALKIALFTSSASLDKTSVTYATTNEVVGTGYTAGGAALAYAGTQPAAFGDEATLDFDDVSWPSSTITANGCIIYNTARSNKIISVHAFSGGDKTSTAGTFSIVFPTPGAGTSIIRIA
jgi:hypothetical protein